MRNKRRLNPSKLLTSAVRACCEPLEPRRLFSVFTMPAVYATNPFPSDLVVADFNKDGADDVAVVSDGNKVSVHLNTKDVLGTLAPKVDYAVGSKPMFIRTEDFNGDTYPDLVVNNTFNYTFSVLLNNGNGTFAAKIDVSPNNLIHPLAFTTGDFNKDNKADVIIAGTDGRLFFGNGNGTFAPEVNVAAPLSPVNAFTGDFNGDGWLDYTIRPRERRSSEGPSF